jgi:hypothetical protein
VILLVERFESHCLLTKKSFLQLQDPDLIHGAAELLQELSLSSSQSGSNSSIPVGHWRDGLWGGLCAPGPFHSSVWTAVCCVPIASAQVISRLHLSAWGKPHPSMSALSGKHRTAIFRTIVTAVVAFWCTRVLLFFVIAILDPNTSSDATTTTWVEPGTAYYACCALDDLLACLYTIACVWQLRNVRRHVRSAFAIPGSAVTDMCCSLTCPCLVAAQLLRHTGDYNDNNIPPQQYSRYNSYCHCCSETGLPVNAPSVV